VRKADDIRERVLKDGRRVYDLWFTVNGRKRGQRAFATKKDARAFKRAALADADRGAYVPASRITFGAYLTRWLDARRTGPTTDMYRRHVAAHVVDVPFRLPGDRRLADVRLQRLQPEDLGALYRWLEHEHGLSPNTVRLVHGVLRQALRDAVENGHVARNVAVLARKSVPHHVKPDIHPYTTDEARALLVAARADRLHALWRLYLTVGLRRGEGLQLQWRDVDLDERLLVVCRGGSSGSTKTGKSRTWSLDAVTVEALRARHAAQIEERLALGRGQRPAPADRVFTREDGRPITDKLIRDWHIALERAAGIARHRRIHDMRHTAACVALANGVPVKVVSEMLGHASVAFTLDRYAHVLPSMQADAAERIAGLLDQ